MADVNLLLVIVIAILMMVIYEVFSVLQTQITSGVWDYGMLAATGIYSLIIGVIAGITGVLNLNMPIEQWLPVLTGLWGAYFFYLTALHTVMDYIISKIFPVKAPQGLATPFLTEKGKQAFSVRI